MKLKKRIADIFNQDNQKVAEIKSGEVILDALCAHRDYLIMMNSGTLEDQARLMILEAAIQDIVKIYES